MDYSTKPFTFKKKPVAIEAIKWTGTNFDTIKMTIKISLIQKKV